jgi:hypothetical protein
MKFEIGACISEDQKTAFEALLYSSSSMAPDVTGLNVNAFKTFVTMLSLPDEQHRELLSFVDDLDFRLQEVQAQVREQNFHQLRLRKAVEALVRLVCSSGTDHLGDRLNY